MKKLSIFLIALSMDALANADTETKGPYAGATLGLLAYDEGGGIEADITMLNGRLGTFINENLSAEMRLGIGLAGDTVSVFGTPVDVDINYIMGAYLRAGLPVSEKIYPYAIIGLSRGEIEASAGGFTVKEAESDTSFGLGVEIMADKKFGFTAEYMNVLDKDGIEISGFSIGAMAKF